MSEGDFPEIPAEDGAMQVADTLPMENPFWRFSLTVYEAPAVRQVCLEAQDRFGVDVNLMLLCCWVGFAGVKLDAKGLKRLDQLVDGWRREVLEPVRAVRRRLAGPIGPMGPQATKPLRDQVKAMELQAEQIQQAVLFKALETLPGRDARQAERSGVARLNLTVYLRDVRGVSDAQVLREIVEQLVLGCRDRLESDEEEEG